MPLLSTSEKEPAPAGITMKLYYSPFSSNSRKVRLAAAELGATLELVHINIVTGAQRAPDYLALNPMGRVPLLDDGGFLLSESSAIMMYLADASHGDALYPREVRPRADVNRWLFWGAGHWGPTIAALAFENMLKSLLRIGEPDAAQVKRHEEALLALGGVIDAHLQSRDFLLGSTLSIADLAIAAPLMLSVAAKLPLRSFTNLQAWFDRIQLRDSWKATEPPTLPPGAGSSR